ncbi:MAG: amidase [Ottowia sp.]
MSSIAFSSLEDLSAALAERSLSSEEITRACLERIARLDPKASAFVDVYQDAAIAQARAADLERASGLCRSPLHGVPVAVKDLCELEGRVTTGGSAAWRARRSGSTAAVIRRLREAGMIVLGKTHTVEFAFGGWGTNEHMGTPRNPWSWNGPHRVPGGSSSGSGVAVAAGLAPVAIGTDTGGSVRIPSAMTGITGLKTTFGRVSLDGVIPLSRTLDSVGPMARSARDAAMVYALIRQDAPVPQERGLGISARPVRALRIACMAPSQYPWPVDAATARAVEGATEVFRSLGTQVETVELPVDFGALAAHLGIIISAEAYREHGEYIGDPLLPFSEQARRRVLGGRDVTAARYLLALEARCRTTQRFRAALDGFDLLLTPTVPFGAPPADAVDEDTTPMSVFTRPVNYLGGCAISLPCGFDADGMPLGVQLIAAPWQEDLLLAAGESFQAVTDWHRRVPPGLD